MTSQVELIRLDKTGDTPILWDTNDPASCREAAEIIAVLKSQGYMFFSVDGSEVVDGATADGVVHARPRKLTSAETDELADPAQPKRGRGRPKKVIAVPAMKGG